jgi:hypothetical protein
MKTVPAIGILLFLAAFPLFSHAQENRQENQNTGSPASIEAGAFSVSSKKDSIGNVQIGNKKTDSVTVTNRGNSTLTISNTRSSNARFTVGPASLSIPAGAAKKFAITFAPTAAGAQSSFIVFTHNGPTSPDTVTASGTGTVPAFSVDRKTIPYGIVVIATGKPDSVQVTNTGTAALVISGVTSTNTRFSINPTGGTIQPGAKSTFVITFTPTVNGLQNGNIVFVHNAPNVRDTVAVSGTGTGFSVNRRSVAFGNVQVGSSSKDSVVVTNSAATTLTISNVTSSNGTFAVSPTNASIAAAGTAKFRITFTPGNTATQTGNVVFTHTASSSPDTVAVSGTGILPGFSLNRKNVPFGLVPLGQNRLDSVIVTDTGKAALVISNVVSSNGTFTVIPTNVTLQPAQARTFYITFTPANTNPQSGNIVFTHNAPGAHDTVAVTGTGGAAGFTVTRRSVAFGTVGLGGNKLDSVSVTNTGALALVISNVASSNGTFAVNPTNVTLQPAQARTFYITFTPANTNPQSGNIVFTHTGPTSPDTVTVSGTGGTPGFSVTRRSVAFGTVPLGGNRPDSVSVTNTGALALVISNVASSNGAFTVNPTNVTLQPAQARTFYITFTPANTNPQSGNIVFTHNAPSTHDTVAVSGAGGTAGFSVTRRFVPFGNVALGGNKLDSISVTNAGLVALVISNVTSSNGTFSVNPTNATLQPAQARTFYITFTPANTNPQSGNIVFTHTASTSPDTVTVSGTGGSPGFSLNRKTVPFGVVNLGGNRLDSVIVSDTGTSPLVISTIASSNGTFTVNPANATIQPAGTETFYITFTPVNTTPQNGNLVFNHNAPSLHDTVATSGTAIAPLPAPVLLAPASGPTGQALPVALSWSSVTGAAGYWLEISTDTSFTTIVISDPTLVSTGRQVSGLPQNSQYYWRVSTRNSAGAGPFSLPWTFTTLPSGPISGTVSFSGDLTSTSYRMFGLPGVGARRVGDILSGTQMIDWRILRDNGKDTTYPAYYEDLNAASALNTGEGYWLLQKTDLNISRTDTLPPLSTDGTYGITLHSGWNMISNPFNASVQRSAVIAANGLPAGTLFWEHVGATRTSSGATFDPFKGYYFDNDTASLAKLKIPYPFSTTVAKLAKAPGVDWRVELVFDSDINTDRDNYIGIAPAVKPGRNELDQHEAPLVFDEGFLYFVRPEWDAVHSRFATDMRGALGTGQTWDFEVWNPRNGTGKITLHGLEGIPPQNQVVLVNALNTAPVDMRRTNVYTYQTSSKKMQFKLFVGTKEYVDGETSKLIPQAYELAQNYPNPFNPSTTIQYMLPAGAYVRLEIFSVIGQRVRVLDEGYRSAAAYSVTWDGKDENRQTVSSGVYFCRLTAGENAIRTRKLVLVR